MKYRESGTSPPVRTEDRHVADRRRRRGPLVNCACILGTRSRGLNIARTAFRKLQGDMPSPLPTLGQRIKSHARVLDFSMARMLGSATASASTKRKRGSVRKQPPSGPRRRCRSEGSHHLPYLRTAQHQFGCLTSHVVMMNSSKEINGLVVIEKWCTSKYTSCLLSRDHRSLGTNKKLRRPKPRQLLPYSVHASAASLRYLNTTVRVGKLTSMGNAQHSDCCFPSSRLSEGSCR